MDRMFPPLKPIRKFIPPSNVLSSKSQGAARNQIRNPNIEIRNKLRKKSISNWENPKHRVPKEACLELYYFGHLKLFRISDFVLRIFCSRAPMNPYFLLLLTIQR